MSDQPGAWQPSWTTPKPGDSFLRRLPLVGGPARFRQRATELAEHYNATASAARARHDAAVADMRAVHAAGVADMQVGFYRDSLGNKRHIQDDPAAMQTAAQMRANGWTADAAEAARGVRQASAPVLPPDIAKLFEDSGLGAAIRTPQPDFGSPAVILAMRYQEAQDRRMGPAGMAPAPPINARAAQRPTPGAPSAWSGGWSL